MCVVQITVTKNKLYRCHGYLLVEIADCRLQTADWIQNVNQVQNVDSRLQSRYKMQTENLKSSFCLVGAVVHKGQLQTNVYWCKQTYVGVNKYILIIV